MVLNMENIYTGSIIKVFLVLVFCHTVVTLPSSLRIFRRKLALQACGSVEPEKRQDCGFIKVYADECLDRGCCWQPCESCQYSVPWCYLPSRAYLDGCVDTPCGERVACGEPDISWTDCERRDCCWSPTSEPGAPWCFNKPVRDSTTPRPKSTPIIPTHTPSKQPSTTSTSTTTKMPTMTTEPLLEVRLAGGYTRFEGRLEILHNRVWGGVCGESWTVPAANVICRQLGYRLAAQALKGQSVFGNSSVFWAKEPQCYGVRDHFGDCRFSEFGEEDMVCSSNQVLSLYCELPESLPELGFLRLSEHGYVGVYHEGEWGTVCDDGWTLDNAHVVCNQLGFPGAKRSSSGIGGIGRFLLDDVVCTGHEGMLFQCAHSGWGVHNCGNYDGVTVYCNTNPAPPNIRLVGGTNSSEGRVEVFFQDRWGTVCGQHWTRADGDVVCRQLGFSGAQEVFNRSEFGEGYGPIWLSHVGCFGDESSLDGCWLTGWSDGDCDHDQEAGLMCQNATMV